MPAQARRGGHRAPPKVSDGAGGRLLRLLDDTRRQELDDGEGRPLVLGLLAPLVRVIFGY